MRVLHISILDKKATYQNRDGDIICGNSDYVIEFAFDTEWAAHEEKIARFIWNSAYKDVTFTGTTCPVPIITGASEVEVGVYAGELSTTTPAVIGCQKSILCQSTSPGGIPFTKGEKGDPGVGEILDINIVLDGKYKWDKTTSEILAAYLEGKMLRARFSQMTTTQFQISVTDSENLKGTVICLFLNSAYHLQLVMQNNQGKDTTYDMNNFNPLVPIVTRDDEGKILGVTNSRVYWLDPKEVPGIDDVFTVNITYEDSQHKWDKTTAEIIAAYLDGKQLRANFNGHVTAQVDVEITDAGALTGKVTFKTIDDTLYRAFSSDNLAGYERFNTKLIAKPLVPAQASSDKGKVLCADGSRSKWISPSEIPGVDDVFVVNFTLENGRRMFDKTVAEILAAYLEGKMLRGNYLGSISTQTWVWVGDEENLIGSVAFTFAYLHGLLRIEVFNTSGKDTLGIEDNSKPYVPTVGESDDGKVLVADGTTPKWISPSEIPGGDDVFTVNYTSVSGGYYACEKTTSEILAAYLAGKTMIGVLDNKYVSTLFNYSVEDSENLVGYAKCYFICKNGVGTARPSCSEIIVYNTIAEERVTYHNYHDPFLPNITSSADNGKILGYVNNETQWLAPSELGIGGTNIITATSKAELPDPSTVEEGTIALVPSEGGGGGGGLPVIELTTPLSASGVEFTDSEHAALSAAADTGLPIIVKATMEYMEGDITEYLPFSAVGTYFSQGGIRIYYASLPFGTGGFIEFDGRWTFNVE